MNYFLYQWSVYVFDFALFLFDNVTTSPCNKINGNLYKSLEYFIDVHANECDPKLNREQTQMGSMKKNSREQISQSANYQL